MSASETLNILLSLMYTEKCFTHLSDSIKRLVLIKSLLKHLKNRNLLSVSKKFRTAYTLLKAFSQFFILQLFAYECISKLLF